MSCNFTDDAMYLQQGISPKISLFLLNIDEAIYFWHKNFRNLKKLGYNYTGTNY